MPGRPRFMPGKALVSGSLDVAPPVRRAALVALLAIGPALALVARADAYLYWDNGSTQALGRANLDGSGVNPRFIADTGLILGGVAVGGAHAYWVGTTEFGNPAIGRANLDGSGTDRSFISFISVVDAVAVGGAHIYWTHRSDTIGRANLDGSGVDESFIVGASDPKGVAVSGRHVYWADRGSGAIGRANLEGSGVDQSFIAASRPLGVAVDRRHVYWSNGSNKIGRANLDGSGVDRSFIAGARKPVGLAVDSRHIYWTNGTKIGRAKLDGSGIDHSFITATGSAWVAVDALPSNAFSFGRKRVLADGSAQLEMRIPGRGVVSAKATSKRGKKGRSPALIKRASERTTAAGTETLTLRPTEAAQRLLRRGRTLPVRIRATFKPAGGVPANRTTRIRLRKAKAFVLPRRSNGCRVTNSGRITATNGDVSSFGGTAKGGRRPAGRQTYEDTGPATPLSATSTKILAVTCNRSQTRASIFGTANVSGQGAVDLRIDLADRGKTGSNDTYRIRLTTGYDSGTRKLERGDVRIRKRI